MRALNHEHIFRLPLAPDNGLDLDRITPGLDALSRELKEDERYVTRVRALGALYLDSGFERALEVVRLHLEPYFQAEAAFHGLHDYKSILQEQTQRTHGLSPQYEVVEEFGPDHDKRFQISVTFGGEAKGIGWGKSKKEAEQEAAKKALDAINAESQLPVRMNVISRLKNLFGVEALRPFSVAGRQV
jgi:hypothetical protein